MTLASGTRLGPYEISSPVGAGGMGEVYRAKDTRLNRTVAVKILPSHLAHSPELRERFEREARAIAGGFEAGTPQPLFELRPNPTPGTQYDVTADGQRFIVSVPVRAEGASPLTLVLNWPALLQR